MGKSKQTEKPISLQTWQRLYDAATKIRKMQPWDWMEETDIFGIRVPTHETTAFVSVMGLLGEFLSVTVYPSQRELQKSIDICSLSDNRQRAELLLETRQIQLIFGGTRDIESKDRRILKELGLKFRGHDAWPYFRSIHPGHLPWFIEPSEATLLTVALEQLLILAPKLREDETVLDAVDGSDDLPILEVPPDGPNDHWNLSWESFEPQPEHLHISVANEVMQAARFLPSAPLTVEVDVFSMPMMPIGTKKDRPQCPYLLLAVDTKSEFVVAGNLVTIENSLEEMRGSIAEYLFKAFINHKMRPETIVVKRDWIYAALLDACKHISIEVILENELAALEQVRFDFENQFGEVP